MTHQGTIHLKKSSPHLGPQPLSDRDETFAALLRDCVDMDELVQRDGRKRATVARNIERIRDKGFNDKVRFKQVTP